MRASKTRFSGPSSGPSPQNTVTSPPPKILAARYKNPRSKSEYLTQYSDLTPVWATLYSLPYESIAEFIDKSHAVTIAEFDAANALIIMNTAGKYKSVDAPRPMVVGGSRSADKWWGTGD